MQGTATANVARAGLGTLTRGRRDATAPGRRTPGSGIAATTPAPATNPATKSHQGRCVGAGPYCTSRLVPSAPNASPAVADVLASSGASSPLGLRSSKAAL